MIVPKIPSFFKTRKPKAFEYIPRYYNENKEKMDERYKRISSELNVSWEEKEFSDKYDIHRATALRHTIKKTWRNEGKKVKGNTTFRLVIIMAGLCLLAYWLLK
ncbi:hypothetical protein FLAV_02342 [Flavobacteriales bacterium]|nr:hypothetical protein [Flavobacteriales bacterium]MCL4816762.1 hypothetical protein [Flavobacteriales bacterium]WKZ74089.1 MAG: hypothetical protein QY303_08010 [Vicingaceae bacterium]GIK70381.1 MAG: hypothetical protein BroJett020_16760 [Bacteroidota bacterium]CAG0991708.1 hypothetical protein FLAV_02342 [Flavobacteriales bacterium]